MIEGLDTPFRLSDGRTASLRQLAMEQRLSLQPRLSPSEPSYVWIAGSHDPNSSERYEVSAADYILLDKMEVPGASEPSEGSRLTSLPEEQPPQPQSVMRSGTTGALDQADTPTPLREESAQSGSAEPRHLVQ